MSGFSSLAGVAAIALLLSGKMHRHWVRTRLKSETRDAVQDERDAPGNLWVAAVRASEIRDAQVTHQGHRLAALHVRYAGSRTWYCVAHQDADVRKALQTLSEAGVDVPDVEPAAPAVGDAPQRTSDALG